MAFVHKLYSASGLSSRDCCSLGQRYDDGVPFSVYRTESLVIRIEPREGEEDVTLSVPYTVNRHFTSLWRSPERIVYITNPQEGIIVAPENAPQSSKHWEEESLGVALVGVWGLDDGTVFTWGRQQDGDTALFRWNGKAWKPMPSPGPVVKMHGLSPKDILAVGHNGLIAHWDGKSWTEIPVDTEETLGGVFMVSGNEYYVVGHAGGVFEGSVSGCRRKIVWEDGMLADVAKFAGKVWVAAPFQGLLQLKGKKPVLENIKPNLKATSLEARDELLISCPDMIASTADGKTFDASADGYIKKVTKGKKPLWKD